MSQSDVETALFKNNKVLNDKEIGYGDTIIQHDNFTDLVAEIRRLIAHYTNYYKN